MSISHPNGLIDIESSNVKKRENQIKSVYNSPKFVILGIKEVVILPFTMCTQS